MRPKRQKLIIWGTGGHAAVVADIIRLAGQHALAAFVNDVGSAPDTFLGLPVLRSEKELAAIRKRGVRQIIIGIGDCPTRMRLAKLAQELGFQLCSALHPRAIIASNINIGAGTVLAAGAVVNPGASLANNVIVNTCASVDHHCGIGDGVHICPGARLAGDVTVGAGSWIGIGATVIEGVRIGEGTVIGAGAVVVSDIPARVLALGVPAKVKKKLR
jgi:UDP-N-acetylbacillosamine N-acetyltransferase